MKRILATVVLGCVLELTGCSNLESTASLTPANPILNKTISAMNLMKYYCLNTDLTENFTIVEKSNSPSTETLNGKVKDRLMCPTRTCIIRWIARRFPMTSVPSSSRDISSEDGYFSIAVLRLCIHRQV